MGVCTILVTKNVSVLMQVLLLQPRVPKDYGKARTQQCCHNKTTCQRGKTRPRRSAGPHNLRHRWLVPPKRSASSASFLQGLRVPSASKPCICSSAWTALSKALAQSLSSLVSYPDSTRVAGCPSMAEDLWCLEPGSTDLRMSLHMRHLAQACNNDSSGGPEHAGNISSSYSPGLTA